MTIFKKIIISPLLLTLMFMGIFIYFYNQISIVIDSMGKETQSSSMAVKQVHMDSIFQLMELTKEISFNPLLGPEPAELTIILSQLMQYKAIQSAYFVDMDERILADGTPHSYLQAAKLVGQPIPAETQLDIKHDTPIFEIIDNQLVYSHPFNDQGDPIGRLQVIISLDKLNKIQSDLLDKGEIITKKSRDKIRTILLVTLVTIILSFFIAVLFIRRIITNLNIAVDVAKKVSKGNLDIQFEITSMDETGTLLTAMQTMVSNVRKANKTLEKSEEKYRNIFERAIEGIFQTTQDNRFISVNNSMAHMFGYDSSKELISTITDIAKQCHVNPADHHKITNIIQEKGHIQGTEIQFLRKDGSMFWGSQTARAIRNKEGTLLYYEGSLVDITQRKEKEKLEAKLVQSSKMEAIGTLAGSIAHDFNNILGIIMGNTELILMDCKDERTKKTLELIFKQTKRGQSLTRNLVAFAKHQEPKQEFFKISEKIDLVLNLLKGELKGIKLIKEAKLEEPDLLADSGMIEHALVNLIQNAIHATSMSEHPRIFIRVYYLDDNICFEIEDNGCGIPMKYLAKIYEPSFTLKGAKDITGSYGSRIKGTGYGMANVKKYIEQHKGIISVESELGSGTKFTISLPIIKKELTIKEKAEISEELSHFEKSILIVEDEQAISNVQYSVLTQDPCKHKVDIANNGQAGMDLFDRNEYDLISLDYILQGGINGMDVYNHIRESNKSIPILFISGNIEFLESIKDLKQNDANIDHLSKPCQNKDYVSSINKLLGKASADQ